MVHNSLAIGDCPLMVIQQMQNNRFLDFALLNCGGPEPDSNHTMSGSILQSPIQCLTHFEISNTGAYPIPDTGNCRSDILSTIESIGNISVGNSGFSVTQSPDGDSLNMNFMAYQTTSPMLKIFMDNAGYSIVQKPCDPTYIRSTSMGNFFAKYLTTILSDYTRDYSGYGASGYITFPGFFNQTDGSFLDIPLMDGLCMSCYQLALDDMQRGSWSVDSDSYIFSHFPAVILTECANDPLGDTCSNFDAVKRIKGDFLQCTGYQIDFVGPLCPEEARTQFQAYDVLSWTVYCTLFPSSEDCSEWESTVFNYHTSFGMPCYNCIDEIIDGVKTLSFTKDMRSACSSVDSVLTLRCIRALGGLFDEFIDCTGLPWTHLSSISSSSDTTILADGDITRDTAVIPVSISITMILLISIL